MSERSGSKSRPREAFEGVVPAASPVSHVPTLPPKAPAAARYIGPILIATCALVVVIAVAFALVLPVTQKKEALQEHTAFAPASPSPAPPSTTPPSSAGEADPMEDLAPVPLSLGPSDLRASFERVLKRRGLQLGDIASIDNAAAKAARLEKQGREVDAIDAWQAAINTAERAPIDRGTVQAKQKRLRDALDRKGTTNANKMDELLRDVEKRAAARDYVGANDTLNKAALLLK